MNQPRLLRFGLPAIVFLSAFAAFRPALNGGWLDWDDGALFLENDGWRGLGPSQIRWMFTSWPLGHYQPVTWMTHGLDYVVWGMHAWGHHLTSVALHALVGVLLFAVSVALQRRLGDESARARLWSACAATLWAVHPLRTESVAWITERRDLVCGVFYLLTLLCYLRMLSDGTRRVRWYVLTIVAYALSLLSKAWGITLPVVMLLADAWLLGRFTDPAERRRAVLEKIPLFAMAIGMTVVAGFAQRGAGASVSFDEHSFGERVLQGGYGILFYPVKTLVPAGLSPIYLLDQRLRLTDPLMLGSLLGTITITAALIAARRRVPALLVAWLAYVATVSPVLGVNQSGPQLVADRYSYISTMYLFLLVVALPRLLDERRRRLVLAGSAAIACLLGVLSWRQCAHWQNTLALWTRAVDVDPANYFARVQRAITLRDLQRYRESIADCDAAISVTRRYVGAWVCRGLARVALGDTAGLEDLEQALRVNPDSALALRGRGQARLALRDAAGALEDFDRVVAKMPATGAAYAERGVARVAVGDVDGALADFNTAIRLAHLLPQPWLNRAHLRYQRGQYREAIADFDACLARLPGHVPALLGRARARREAGDFSGAAADCEAVLSRTPLDWPLRGEVEKTLAALRARRSP